MAPPTAPYCTTQQVAYYLSMLFPGQVAVADFDDAATIPSKTQIELYIEHVSAEIDLALASVGYKLPLVEWNGEAWPGFQTYLLRLIACLGAAAHAVNDLRPAPATGNGKPQDQGNSYLTQYDDKLRAIREGAGLRIRADCYVNTPAFRRLYDWRAPMTDWGQGIVDAADYATWGEATQFLSQTYDQMRAWAGGTLDRYALDLPEAYGRR
ncbi:MAG: hypothetical protein GXY76_08745 [Chloroflexi bacterium]|nr:hypothetical protein [Chloroflexota bacterium]